MKHLLLTHNMAKGSTGQKSQTVRSIELNRKTFSKPPAPESKARKEKKFGVMCTVG
jgi:hypothetical protein